MAKAVLALLVVALAGGAWYVLKCDPPKPPTLNPDEWWGPNELKAKQDKSIRPFQVTFSPEMIQDLKQRLNGHRKWTPALEGVGFEYGFNSKKLDSWVQYWAEKYNFSAREKFLNQFPQYKTNIQGLDIHFIRVKPQVPAGVEVVPLLLLHGWPGSVREFYEAIPLLTTNRPPHNFAFEVIVPSLPGYGFSDGAVRPGLGAPEVAMVMRNLMNRLGFNKYYIQGGDWGAVIAGAMAVMFPDQVLGHHSNMLVVQNSCTALQTLIGAVFPSLVMEPELADRLYPLSKLFAHMMEEFGYFHLQATKPDTVGVALTDSPSGLLAYILEKFSTWTREEHRYKPDGALEFRFTRDQLIDNLMMYWTPSSITTSMRLYAETMSRKTRARNMDSIPTSVPTWALQAKHELFYQPPSMLRTKYKQLVGHTVLQDGGHFLAFELPKVFAEDVFKAVKAFRDLQDTKKKTEL